MRRRIQLYLGGQAADLPDDALVLFNWATTDASNPTIVKNSFSQSFNLPRTPRNEAIFGHSGRLDRTAGGGGTGAAFNASRKLPFTIYNETSEVLASGYAKLDSVTDDALAVSLYGGLGELLYNLSYDSAGNKRTLASLDFGGGDAELDFDITAQAVSDAWERLRGDSSKPAMWDIINFAPAYNGIPENFDAQHAIAEPADVGLPSSQTKDGNTYTTNSGKTLVTLPEAVDEWAAKDLRSYLQRPVVSVWKLMQAMADPDNNGGWNVDLTDINTSAKWPYIDVWLTRPLLPSIGGYKSEPGGATITMNTPPWTTTNPIASYAVTGIGAGVSSKSRVSVWPSVKSSEGGSGSTLHGYADSGTDVNARRLERVVFYQAVAFASDNTMVGAGPVVAYYRDADRIAADTLASFVGYTPQMGAAIASYGVDYDYPYSSGVNIYRRARPVTLEVEAVDVARVEVWASCYMLTCYRETGRLITSYPATDTPVGQFFFDYHDQTSGATISGVSAEPELATISEGVSETLRSGAHITKQYLLGTEGTPADYLLAVCKTFGFYLLTDPATKSVKVLRRTSFFVDETIDLTDRVDTSKGIEITPLGFDTKWYDFKHEGVGGAFEKEYERTEGVQFGIARVDTNYDYDAETKDLLSGSVLRSCAAVRDMSKYWCYIVSSGVKIPALFLTAGCKQTLWNGTDTAEFDISSPNPSDVLFYDAAWHYYDRTHLGRAEFRDGTGKALDGADVLLFYTGEDTLQQFALTDDIGAMDALNGGPCWLLGDNSPMDVPEFSRYTAGMGLAVDFGTPRELALPDIAYPDGITIYSQAWQAYIADRLSVHSKVLKCRVLFDGLQVGPELLRKFYWYRGSLWVLNKISNYSLTTFDAAECEFIQVRDKSAYLAGNMRVILRNDVVITYDDVVIGYK